MENVKFETRKGKKNLILLIANRAIKEKLTGDTVSLSMDLSAVSAKYNINLKKLLKFDDFNFAHDIYGIMDNLNRETGELENYFSPRCLK